MLQINNWNECPIDIAYEIYDILISQDFNDVQKNIKLISLLYDISEDDVYKMPMTEYNKYLSGLSWISKMPNLNQKYAIKYIDIDGVTYIVTPLNKLAIGQYIDFQTFWQKKDERKYIGNILASFLVPKGKKYGDGYDLLELANKLRTHLDIVTGRNLMFFFLKRYLDLMVSSFIYSRNQMKTKEEKDQVTMTLNIILDGLA